MIIHDSVCINKYIDMTVDKYKILLGFEHRFVFHFFKNKNRRRKSKTIVVKAYGSGKHNY